jgi:hypothetical protein
MVMIALKSGEIILRAPYEDGNTYLTKLQSGMENIVDITSP